MGQDAGRQRAREATLQQRLGLSKPQDTVDNGVIAVFCHTPAAPPAPRRYDGASMRIRVAASVAGLLVAAAGVRLSAQDVLAPAQSLTQTLPSGETRRFVLDAVPAGDAVQITLNGHGALLRLTVTDSEGVPLVTRERRAGLRTPIVWVAVAERTGAIGLAVTSLESGAQSRPFTLAYTARGAADGGLRAAAAATAAVAEAEHRERQGPGQVGAAIERYAEAAAKWRESGDLVMEAVTELERGRLLLDAGRPADATTAMERARTLCRDAGDARCEGAALHRVGRLRAVTGQPQAGFDTLQAALALRERLGDEAGQAETLMELGGLEATRSANDRAEDFLTRAVALARSSGDRRTEADATNMRAVLSAGLGELDRARELYESALAIRIAIGDETGVGQTTSNLGVLLRSAGEPRLAIARYGEALAIRRRIGALQPLANTLHNLGVVHADLGEHDTALELFREALDLWRKSRGRRGEAFTLQAIGQAYARLGNPAQALEHYELCAPVWKEVGDKRGEAQTLLAAAAIRASTQDPARALAGYEAALALARQHGYQREVAWALLGRGQVRRAQGAIELALNDAYEAHAILADIGERREEGRAMSDVADALAAAGRSEEALASFHNAIALLEAVEDRAEEATVRARLAAALERTGDAAAARTETLRALDLVESARAQVSAEGLSVSLFASKRGLYDSAIALLMRMAAQAPSAGHDREAFAVSERMRARALLDLVASGEMQPAGRSGGAVAELQRLQEVINAKALRLTRLLAAPTARNAPQASAARREMDDLLARLDAQRAVVRANDFRGGARDPAAPTTLEETQARLLDSHTALLSFAVGRGQTTVWVVTDTSHHTFQAPGRETLEPFARRVRDGIDEHNTVVEGEDAEARRLRLLRASRTIAEALSALSAHLVTPASSALRGRSRLLVVADRVLHSLPFAALRATPSNPTLGETHDIVQLPSASVGLALAARAAGRGPRSSRVAVFADPVFSNLDSRVPRASGVTPAAALPSLPRLRFSQTEADAIARLAPRQTTVWSGFSAARSTALDDGLGAFGIIHFAAHAVVDEERPPLSGIVLSQIDGAGRPQNGVVRLHEIYNLSLDARLVVLSACRTALGRPVEGEGLLGLTRGFLHAGADAVVATLWDVDDRATAAFMAHFYAALLKERQAPAAALRRARQAMIADARFAAPDWMAFVLIGQ